jgi:hypothetical protein
MNWNRNPFQELYLSDSLVENAFVELFSPEPLTSALNPVFQDGNVVLSGVQGCGKTMILRLLQPETRIAYAEGGLDMPASLWEARFLSAGVNLTKSGLCDVGQVTLGKGDSYDIDYLPYFFGDFFNYWVLRDLFRNLRTVAGRPQVFKNIVNLERAGAFCRDIVKQDCWFGNLAGCDSLQSIEQRISSRIEAYRRWVMMNSHSVPAEIATSKTAIHEPIARTVECLKWSGVLPDEVKIFIRVDQLEELHQETTKHQQFIRSGFRQMLNRAFSFRDHRLHYRIGSRRYGWNRNDRLVVHGSGARLEARRDYLFIDLSEELERKERRSGWKFPEFAADAYRRRIKYDFGLSKIPSKDLMRSSFGSQPEPQERADHLAKDAKSIDQVDRILRIGPSENWSPEWREWLRKVASESQLEAVLAAAWGRQTGGNGKTENREGPPPVDGSWKKRWWLKERLPQAVLQLVARRSQRLLWWGHDDIIGLSSGNIMVFLHLCHAIWDRFLKEESLKPEGARLDVISGYGIPADTQAVAVQTASREWHEKLAEQPGGDVRRRFIDLLGRRFREQLRDDVKMSYPGANGFSLSKDELYDQGNELLRGFLYDAVGYGDLVASDHTTKNKRGEARVKFYLNPVLSPVFQIPAVHTKEPLYWKVEYVMKIARSAGLPFALDGPNIVAERTRQLSLF